MDYAAQWSEIPAERPEGSEHSSDVDRDWIVRNSTLLNADGQCIFKVAGINETFGADLEYVMVTRRPLHVRRFWNKAVWDVSFTPNDVGLHIHAACVLKMKPVDNLTLASLCEFLNRVSAVLDADAATPTCPRVDAAEPPARLRLLPEPL